MSSLSEHTNSPTVPEGSSAAFYLQTDSVWIKPKWLSGHPSLIWSNIDFI